MGKLEGKVALVTGSGRNIGRATVLKLAGEGAHVVVNARANQQEAESVAREARDLGVKAAPILADVGKKAEVESLAARALSEFGRVDILINNAAIRPHKPFTETTDADWELIRSVVLDGNVLLMVLVGDDRRHVELYAVQVELAAAAGDFPLHSRAAIVDVELRDLLRVLFGLDVDVPELHGHTGLLPRGFTKRRRGDACRSQPRSTRIRTQPAFARFAAFREQDFGVIGAGSPRRPTQACPA
jgi:hypothetical protein